jgi:pimeloyl-ACP methyl ester carboxylesterase
MLSTFLNSPDTKTASTQKQKQEDGDSFTTLLPTPSKRTALALLVLLSTDAMKKDLTQIFEPPPEPSPRRAPSTGVVDDLISFNDHEPMNPPTPSGTASSPLTPYQHQSLVRQRETRLRDLADSQIQGLRRASLTHFEAWRARVLRRVCEVLSVTPNAVKMARKEFVESEKEKLKNKDEKSFLDWAHGEEVPGEEDRAKETGRGEYARISTSLVELDEEKRIKVLNCCLLTLLSLEEYSSLSRVLLLRLATNFHIPRSSLVSLENQTATVLLRAASHLSAGEHAQKEAQANATSRKWKVGLATVAGAALIGVTGGLAAPLLAAGLGTVFGAVGLGAVSGLLGGLLGNAVLIGGLFGAYGAKMTGKMVEELAKDVEDFKFVPLQQQIIDHHQQDTFPTEPAMTAKDTHELRVAIGIPGYLTTAKDIMHPAYVLASPGTEPFALQWEVAALLRLGLSFSSVLKSYVWDVAKFELLRRTLLGALAAGLWPLGLLKMGRVIDNPFNIARIRADKAGKVLAHALIAKCAGNRPVTLVGVSLGARVIFACLQELAAQNAFGIIENAVLIGAPVSSEGSMWLRMRTVVSGRLVNIFSEKDVLLGFVYRASTAQFNIAGLQAIDEIHGVENVNVSDLVDGHTKYRYMTGKILKQIDFENVSSEGLEREAVALKAIEEKAKSNAKKIKNPEKEALAVEQTVEMRMSKTFSEKQSTVLTEKAPYSQKHESDVVQKLEVLQVTEATPQKLGKDHTPSLAAVDASRSYTPESSELAGEKVKDDDPLDRLHIHVNSATSTQIEDLGSDSDLDIVECAELTYLDPEPVEDSDVEEIVNFGGNSGFNITWAQKS